MKLKEKCIYYNPIQECYYLVLAIDDKMVYGRRGDFAKTSNLEDWINQDGPGVGFKIDDIIIYRDYIRNYYLDEECLDQFELVKELSDEEFYPIEILTFSRYNFPAQLIAVHEHMNDVVNLTELIKHKESEVAKINTQLRELEKQLYLTMRCDNI